MIQSLRPSAVEKKTIQIRLMVVAAIFVLVYAACLTLSTSVRLHTWDVSYRWMHWIGVAVWALGFLFVQRQLARYLPEHDPYLLPVCALLTGWGLLTIWRLDEMFGIRQTIWLGLGLGLAGYLLRFSSLIVFLRRYKYLWLVSGLTLTVLTFFFGTYPGGVGPKEWLGCCGVYIQPSEPLKLLLIVYLAAYLADRLPLNFSLIGLLAPTLVLTGAALAILVAQHDLGTAILFIGLYAIIIYIASGKLRLLYISFGIILAAVFVGYRLFDVIKLRVDAWINPWIDATGRAYQIVQSLISVATGSLFGSGIGLGSPGIVPVAHSDFIFSAITEETGLIGAFGIILLMAFITCRGLIIAIRARNHYQRYLASGLTVYLVSQSILIIAGNLRLLPLTGVTLPFVSYGGSSLMTSLMAWLLLLIISNRSEEEIMFYKIARPVIVVGGLLLAGLAAIAAAAGFWGFIESGNLTSRNDNPRWAIEQRYVTRGRILDQNNQPIAVTTGQPGAYTRTVLDPSLSPVIGYTHPLYGQAGLEAAFDPYLRGEQGYPASTIFLANLLYAQNPPGLDLRLSLDLALQQKIDRLFEGHTGAAVLLNAQSGEILAMASYPNFDPNQLDANWNQWVKDSRALFLNRATQGQYPVGSALAPFLLALNLNQGPLTPQPINSAVTYESKSWGCSLLTPSQPDWAIAIQNGCPGAAFEMGQRLNPDKVFQLYGTLGFTSEPQIPLPVAPVVNQKLTDSIQAALGQTGITVSPLQMALAAAMLSTGGNRPSPRIATAVLSPQQGWIILPYSSPSTSILSQGEMAAAFLQSTQIPAWFTTASALTAKSRITWYLSGTIPSWKGAPLALALVLEEDDPVLAQNMGNTIMRDVLEH
ncbi:MAG TPA: FtsW/RodA/SpoVE family cell cycle protein [Anaerolineaceae bacterium]|nr:FtsW/RodA/SpoVE family cell cycle protein [Anaerolineaceae bacterium]